MKYYKNDILLIPIMILAACTPANVELERIKPTVTPFETDQIIDDEFESVTSITEGIFLGLTYQREDGNRIVNGRGNITQSDPIQITVDSEIGWLVAVPFLDGSLWTAALKDGSLESFLYHDGRLESFDLSAGPLPAGAPPMLLIQDGQVDLIKSPSMDSSPLTHPINLKLDSGKVAYITDKGDLVLWESGVEIDRLEVNALPDARLISDGQGRLLFLSAPTDRYDHGVLGDALEAGSISLVKTDPILEMVNVIEIPNSAVVEGIAPIWSDLNSDGEREILVTLSNYTAGSWLVIFSEDGKILAEGPRIGQGYRWRNQLAAAPLGPNGEVMVIDILRPHLDGTLEFFRWDDDRLVLLAELPGFSTHQIGSRNLDMGLVGDLNGDGRLEVVVPDRDLKALNGIGLVNGIAKVLWSVPLNEMMTSNLSGVTHKDGSLVLGVGVGNILLVWE